MKRVLLLFVVLITNIICYSQNVPYSNTINPTHTVRNNIINGINNGFINNSQINEQNERLIRESLKLNKPKPDEYWKTPGFANYTRSYYEAFAKLKDMLTDKIPLSVKDAYYEIESAYGDVFLSKAEYELQIKKSTDFIKQWLKEHHYDLKNNIALHYGIQKFMCDTLIIGNKRSKEFPNTKPLVHKGFYYDYQDYKADKDYRSYHVSKTFATGNGQCHTLPIVYLILAEQLGAKAYLSYAPLHSFIKYPDNKGNIHNFEVTTNWHITDHWYMDNFNIKSLAIKNGIYLNTMDRQQIVACALIDLASSFYNKFGVADGRFINQCIDTALNYFPNKDANISAWLLREKVVNVKLNRIVKKNPDKSKEEIEKIPIVQVLIKELDSIDAKIESLGYEPIPEAIYDKMLQNQENKANIQDLKQFDNLKKRDLFIILNQ